MGTLATVLAKKKIRSHAEVFRADVTGDIEDVDGVLKITRIRVDYTLKVEEEKRQDALDALDNYLTLCPGAQSVVGCIDLQHHMDFA